MGKTSKELEKKLAELQAASVEAGVEYKRLDEQVEQAKLEFGMQVLEGKTPGKSKLNELAEKRDELGMRLNALAKKIRDTQAELAEVKAAERKAKVAEYQAESAKQLGQLEKAIHELNALASKWIDLRGEAEHYMRVELGAEWLEKGGGLSDGDWPVTDIRNRTARWISDRELRKQMMRMMQAAKDKENS